MRLAVGPKESGTQQVVRPLFAHFGFREGKFEPVYAGMADACKKLLAEEVDAVFVVAGIHAESIRKVMATGQVRLKGIGDAAGQIKEPDRAASLAYPIHAGAESYYRRHEPSFFVTYAEVMAFLMSVAISVWGATVAFRNWLTLRKKDRMDVYYVKIDSLLSRLHSDSPVPTSELHAMEKELSRLRKTAVQELVGERLIANESFRIFQALLANSQAEVRRQLERQLERQIWSPTFEIG